MALIHFWDLYSEQEHAFCFNSLCGVMTDAFCHCSWQTALGQHLNTDNAGQEPVRRRGNPTQCLSTNCVFAVFLLGAQYNKVPFAVIAAFLMCSVAAQNFKACCRVTFFFRRSSVGKGLFSKQGNLIYVDNSDMHSCKNINSTKQEPVFLADKMEYFCILDPE